MSSWREKREREERTRKSKVTKKTRRQTTRRTTTVTLYLSIDWCILVFDSPASFFSLFFLLLSSSPNSVHCLYFLSLLVSLSHCYCYCYCYCHYHYHTAGKQEKKKLSRAPQTQTTSIVIYRLFSGSAFLSLSFALSFWQRHLHCWPVATKPEYTGQWPHLYMHFGVCLFFFFFVGR